MSSDQNILALYDGSITRTRAMARIIPGMRWNADRILLRVATPCQERVDALDSIEAEKNPHDHSCAEQPQDDPDAARAKRRLNIDYKDLETHGYSRGCPKCRLYSQGRKEAAHRQHHSEACRERIYARMRAARDPKYLQVGQGDSERLESRSKRTSQESAADGLKSSRPAPDSSSDALEATTADVHEPLSAEDGIDMEPDHYDFLRGDSNAARNSDPHDSADVIDEPTDMNDSEDLPDAAPDDVESDMVVEDLSNMVVSMDTPQALGVDALAANRFAAAIIRETPSLMEFYGRGGLVEMTRTKRRDLNIQGKRALDLRTYRSRRSTPCSGC